MKTREAGLILILAAGATEALAQTTWAGFGGDPGHTRYSTLNQITPANVAKLRQAWAYDLGSMGRKWEATPLVVDDVMYLTLPQGADGVVALDPVTGKQLWKYEAKDSRGRSNRAVSYWPGDAKTPPRLLFASGDKLIALSAKTGQPVKEFGDNGVVNLRIGVADNYPTGAYSFSSPPAIYKDLAILGPSTQETGRYGPSGDPRAFDIRTGKMIWRFHLVPRPGEPNEGTWGPEGWQERSGPSMWGLISVDTERGIVFLPVGNPSSSFYGADRPGTNLYANCVLALDAATGKLLWYFQTTHHDLVDADLAAAPILFDITRNGRKIPAVAQVTKLNMVFILDRLTGKPIYPVEERPAPKSTVPGEVSWPTQPYTVKPAPLGRLSITRDELTTVTPESRQFCLEWWDREHMRNEGVFSSYGSEGTTVMFPGTIGGGNWGGMAFNPQLGYLFVNISNLGTIGKLAPVPPNSRRSAPSGLPPLPEVDYLNGPAYTRFQDENGLPCQQPPWGELAAINVNTGDVAWKVPLGIVDSLEAKGITNTGTPNVGGAIATSTGLVFIGATRDKRFRAFDAKTGKLLWETKLEASAAASPVTYRGKDGKQYVVIAAGGPSDAGRGTEFEGNFPQKLIAFSLP
ncbi:MAG: pyrroloquinoline quinone-dependent dehydrogenase [Bryobacterales bacterium]|nr:pyrroloquinoline quinone-dependent dehydrogenase [Bryobacterales bacterium]MBV9400618.1 pyrroloquinoline quinone-dependent dehydrogenase [Bryobacterales bacterium]